MTSGKTTGQAKRKFFISYAHAEAGEQALAAWFHRSLIKAGQDAFIDAEITLGKRWAAEIERQLESCDYFLLLLSEAAAKSEMVTEEVQRAHSLYRRHQRPTIITVRVRYDGYPGYLLGAILNLYQHVDWKGVKDSKRILKQILQLITDPATTLALAEATQPKPKAKKTAISARPFPAASPVPGSAIQKANFFYIERQVEKPLLAEAALVGETVTIEAPRQIGKSSLLQRYTTAAQATGQQIALVDFSLFNEFHFSRYEDLMRQIADRIARALKVRQGGTPDVGDSVKFTNWIEDHILSTVAEPIMLAFDEADAVFDYEYRRDFFTMLRSWHNLRGGNPNWERLGLAMVISTERNLLVDNATTSPFNIGRHVRLQPFALAECLQLNQRFQQLTGHCLAAEQVRRLYDFLGGQPYLTHQALDAIILDQSHELDDLVETAADEDGLFADHLRALLVRLLKRPGYGLAGAFKKILQGKPVADRLAVGRLKAAGLTRTDRNIPVPANQLYARFFRRAL